MAIAITLKRYLDDQGIGYQTLAHPHSETSLVTAAAAHVPGERLAKAVIVKDDERYLMVVLPADHHVHLGRLHQYLGHEVGLATEQELRRLFPDCEQGAIPPLGAAYDVDTVVDSSMASADTVFFESGDHEHLIQMDAGKFAALLGGSPRVDVSKHM